MKRVIQTRFFAVLYACITIAFLSQSCKPCDGPNGESEDKKPNIYIYPNETIRLNVGISFPIGGNILTSIPEYGSGWTVSVDPDGTIDGKYGFLYYESSQPDVWQQSRGWIVEKGNLELFFTRNLTAYGFNRREIQDFVDYWIPRLQYADIFEIYPQESAIIDRVIKLEFSVKPDNILRMHYLIKGIKGEQNKRIVEPVITPFVRRGFVVAEWGVIFVN